MIMSVPESAENVLYGDMGPRNQSAEAASEIVGVYVPDHFRPIEQQALLAMLQLDQKGTGGHTDIQVTTQVNDIRSRQGDFPVTSADVRDALETLSDAEFIKRANESCRLTPSGRKQGLSF